MSGDVPRLCPVAVRCLAMLDEETAGRNIRALGNWRNVATASGLDASHAHPDLAELWATVTSVRIQPRTPDEFVADIEFTGGACYFSRRFQGLPTLPETLLAALPGRPMTGIIDHPLFADLIIDMANERPIGPAASIPADVFLPRLVEVERIRLIAAATSSTPSRYRAKAAKSWSSPPSS